MVVEEERAAGIVPQFVYLVHRLLPLAEEVQHERLLTGGERLKDQHVHVAVAGERYAHEAVVMVDMPGERRRRDAVEIRMADYMKKRFIHCNSSDFCQ